MDLDSGVENAVVLESLVIISNVSLRTTGLEEIPVKIYKRNNVIHDFEYLNTVYRLFVHVFFIFSPILF